MSDGKKAAYEEAMEQAYKQALEKFQKLPTKFVMKHVSMAFGHLCSLDNDQTLALTKFQAHHLYEAIDNLKKLP